MFVIWGLGTRSNFTNVYVKETCNQCGTTQDMNILTQYNCGTLFFIPIFKLNRKYYIVCPHCGATKQISKADFKQIKYENKNGLVYQEPDVGLSEPETILVESKAELELKSNVETEKISKDEIMKEIDSIIKKLKEKNYVLTPEKVDKFKIVLKEQLMKKFDDEQKIDAVIEEYFSVLK